MIIPTKALVFIAAVLWISFFAMLAIGIFNPELKVLHIAAAPDGILALVLTLIATRRWMNG
jgi:hypothetical protein